MNKRPILITGAHRSGSTWIGTIVGKSPEVCYLFEPFNPDFGPAQCRGTFRRWYTYVTASNEAPHKECISRLLQYRVNLFHEIRAAKTPWHLRQGAEYFLKFPMARLRKQRPLFKDPIALFSADWLHQTFDFQVVVLIRHPAAFAASLKRLDWKFPFNQFLEQPLLMEGPLAPFRDTIETYAANPPGIIRQAVLLWNMIYGRVRDYQEQYPGWLYLRHEDASQEPGAAFERIFDYLDLALTPRLKTLIHSYSHKSNSAEVPEGKATHLKRDSSRAAFGWLKRLTPEEIRQVRELVDAGLLTHFYPEFQWPQPGQA